MHPLLQSIIVLALILAIARFIKRGSDILQKFFIPSALVAGIIGLLLGPQVLNTVPRELTGYWAEWPQYLITIVFAGLFLGKVIPGRKEIWKLSGPMIAFGNTLAWGQYVLGIAATLFFLGPVFGTNPLAGSLVEVSFEGGHGTAAGLAPTFQELGWREGTDIALALATLSIVSAIIIGVLFINWHNRRGGGDYVNDDIQAKQRQQMIRSGYNLITLGRKIQASPHAIAVNLIAFAAAIGLGWLLLQSCVWLEEFALGNMTDIRFFTHLPLFPLAMIGGLIVQMVLRKLGKQTLIQRRTANIISTLALDVLIASAIATISLQAIGNNLPVFLTFGVLGIAWIVLAFRFLAPRMFSSYWFEKGLTNMGQSMGMTATGLLLGRLADPGNRAKARESFGYKQLVFEPFMGGGIVTVGSLIVLYEFGQVPVLIAVTLITVFWLALGLHLGKKRTRSDVTKINLQRLE